MIMNHSIGVKGKTTVDTGMFYAPYIPVLNLRSHELWERKFAWWPVRCSISNKVLWLTFAYRQYLKWREDMFIRYAGTKTWHDVQEHTIYLLKE